MSWQAALILLAVLAVIFLSQNVRTVVFNLLATGIFFVQGVITRIWQNAPAWVTTRLANAANWATQVAARTGQAVGQVIGMIGWILVAATLAVVAGIFFKTPMIVVFALVPLALLIYLLFRGVDVTGRIFSSFGVNVDLGIAQTLQTWAITLVVYAILALVFIGSDTLSTKSVILIGLGALVISFVTSVAGSKITFGRRLIMWGIPLLIALVVIPEFAIKSENPVIVGLRTLTGAVKERSGADLIKLANHTDPGKPMSFEQRWRETNRQFVADEIGRFEAVSRNLLNISKTRNLTKDELTQLKNSYQRIETLQGQLRALRAEEKPSSVSIPSFKTDWFSSLTATQMLVYPVLGLIFLALIITGVRKKSILTLIGVGALFIFTVLAAQAMNKPTNPTMYGQGNPYPLPGTILQGSFPVPNPTYSPIVDKYVAAFPAAGLSNDLVYRVIGAESQWNPNAVSPKGAEGLMQLIPATAARYNVSNSFDPDQNIRGGVNYLSDLLKRYNGDQAKALAAYNWGEGNVDKYKFDPNAVLLANAPKETRDYVNSIMTGTIRSGNGQVLAAAASNMPTGTLSIKKRSDVVKTEDGWVIVAPANQILPVNIPLESGSYRITVTGKVAWDPRLPKVGPDGGNKMAGEYFNAEDFPVPDEAIGKPVLVLSSGQPIGLESFLEIDVPDSQMIKSVTTNDRQKNLSDNTGSWVININKM